MSSSLVAFDTVFAYPSQFPIINFTELQQEQTPWHSFAHVRVYLESKQ